MTLDDIAALAGLRAKATPGPWYVPADEPCNITNSMEEGACVAGCDFLEGAHDAALIAAAVNALPALLALARRGLEVEGAVAEIAVERRRQMEAESWSPNHDDRHTRGELARAASCYAVVGGMGDSTRDHYRPGHPPRSYATGQGWPWDAEWWKPKDRRRDLIRAGALIVAEIERLDRAAQREVAPEAVLSDTGAAP